MAHSTSNPRGGKSGVTLNEAAASTAHFYLYIYFYKSPQRWTITNPSRRELVGKDDEGEQQCILCIYMTKVSLVFNSDQEKELEEQMNLSQVVPHERVPFT